MKFQLLLYYCYWKSLWVFQANLLCLISEVMALNMGFFMQLLLSSLYFSSTRTYVCRLTNYFSLVILLSCSGSSTVPSISVTWFACKSKPLIEPYDLWRIHKAFQWGNTQFILICTHETGNEQLCEKSEIEREKNKWGGGGKEGLQCWHFFTKRHPTVSCQYYSRQSQP